MSRAMLARKAEAAPAAPTLSATKNPPSALRIGASGDAFEQEADRVADAVMASGDKSPPQWSLSRMSIDAPLQRQCCHCALCEKPSPVHATFDHPAILGQHRQLHEPTSRCNSPFIFAKLQPVLQITIA